MTGSSYGPLNLGSLALLWEISWPECPLTHRQMSPDPIKEMHISLPGQLTLPTTDMDLPPSSLAGRHLPISFPGICQIGTEVVFFCAFPLALLTHFTAIPSLVLSPPLKKKIKTVLPFGS